MILTDNERVMTNKPLFSVVTVCYNSSSLIRKTVKSVLMQDFSDFEYIIKDGASTDDTLLIVNEYKDAFFKKNIPLIIDTGNDMGIYDAMNKAVGIANGRYVIFMNADDCFYSENVLSDVKKSLKENIYPDIIYGDCIVSELGMYFKFRKCRELIEERMPFSHQACFAKRELLINAPFDVKIPITADYDFLLKCHVNNCDFFDCNVIISIITADGVSSVNMYDAFTEACKVCEYYGIPRYKKTEMKRKVIEMKIKQFVLDCFPTFIKKWIRKYQVKKRGQCTDVTLPLWINE